MTSEEVKSDYGPAILVSQGRVKKDLCFDGPPLLYSEIQERDKVWISLKRTHTMSTKLGLQIYGTCKRNNGRSQYLSTEAFASDVPILKIWTWGIGQSTFQGDFKEHFGCPEMWCSIKLMLPCKATLMLLTFWNRLPSPDRGVFLHPIAIG